MAFFGMNASQVESLPEGFASNTGECLVCEKHDDKQAHCLFCHLRAADVVFLKEFTPQNGLVIFAAGVVTPGSLIENEAGTCAHVHWEWRGERHATTVPDEVDDARGNPVYEEFDLGIQREIIDLLPHDKHDPFSMVMDRPVSKIPWAVER